MICLVYGLFFEEDFKGLVIGVKVLEDMVNVYWEVMVFLVCWEWGCVGVYDWFVEKIGFLVEGKKLEGE